MSWVFFGPWNLGPSFPTRDRTHWKRQSLFLLLLLFWKDPDGGKDWRREEKGTTEDEMAGWHHWLDGHEFEQTPGAGDGQGGLAWCRPWGRVYISVLFSLFLPPSSSPLCPKVCSLHLHLPCCPVDWYPLSRWKVESQPVDGQGSPSWCSHMGTAPRSGRPLHSISWDRLILEAGDPEVSGSAQFSSRVWWSSHSRQRERERDQVLSLTSPLKVKVKSLVMSNSLRPYGL